jgi:hypothetical protein
MTLIEEEGELKFNTNRNNNMIILANKRNETYPIATIFNK